MITRRNNRRTGKILDLVGAALLGGVVGSGLTYMGITGLDNMSSVRNHVAVQSEVSEYRPELQETKNKMKYFTVGAIGLLGALVAAGNYRRI
jgi:hypothetical protein